MHVESDFTVIHRNLRPGEKGGLLVENPDGDTRLMEGDHLVVIGTDSQLDALKNLH